MDKEEVKRNFDSPEEVLEKANLEHQIKVSAEKWRWVGENYTAK